MKVFIGRLIVLCWFCPNQDFIVNWDSFLLTPLRGPDMMRTTKNVVALSQKIQPTKLPSDVKDFLYFKGFDQHISEHLAQLHKFMVLIMVVDSKHFAFSEN